MYIKRCDRCGKEQSIKSLLAFFGGDDHSEEKLSPVFTITKVGEFKEITLCPECETKLSAWIFGKPKTCCNCVATKYDDQISWKDGDRDTQGAYVCSLTHQLIYNTRRGDYCPLDDQGVPEAQE